MAMGYSIAATTWSDEPLSMSPSSSKFQPSCPSSSSTAPPRSNKEEGGEAVSPCGNTPSLMSWVLRRSSIGDLDQSESWTCSQHQQHLLELPSTRRPLRQSASRRCRRLQQDLHRNPRSEAPRMLSRQSSLVLEDLPLLLPAFPCRSRCWELRQHQCRLGWFGRPPAKLRPSWAGLIVFFAWTLTWRLTLAADSGEVYPDTWVQNPVARHTSCPVAANQPTVCTLVGVEDAGQALYYRIQSLPESGLLYETSGNFRMWGSDPKHMPDPIGPHLLPFLVTDPLRRIVYVPPANAWPPEGAWSTFTFTVELNLTAYYSGASSTVTATTTAATASEPGLVVLSNPSGVLAGSTFDLASNGDGWEISGNLADDDAEDGGLRHQSFSWGALNRYIYGTDEVQYLDFGSGVDRSKWYFEAPKSTFATTALTSAYGGYLSFTVSALYGNFSELNAPLDWVTIECAACDSGGGARMVRFTDDHLWWDGSERSVSLRLLPLENWQLDPLNSALDFEPATECQIAAILSNVSRIAILGDFTRGGEGVAIDNIMITQAPVSEQPRYPVDCQKGCPCNRHNPEIIRPTCC